MSKVILFCGVESTGKTTAIENMYNYFKNQGQNIAVVWEYGREVCDDSGGVFDMTLLDYEKILYGHQSNLLKLLNESDIILLDTDSLYTLHYLNKDKKRLSNDKSKFNYLAKLAKKIAENNAKNNVITQVLYLNSDCEFVQDGTRTYESTRNQDDKNLLKLYKKYYKNIVIISGKDFDERTTKILKMIDQFIK